MLVLKHKNSVENQDIIFHYYEALSPKIDFNHDIYRIEDDGKVDNIFVISFLKEDFVFISSYIFANVPAFSIMNLGDRYAEIYIDKMYVNVVSEHAQSV